MDRRHFFKMLFITPILSPIFLSLKSLNGKAHLYFISDSPQSYLSIILHTLRKQNLVRGYNFTLLNSFSSAACLKRSLCQKGWKYVQSPSKADLFISFYHLQQKAEPSFALVKDGKILDVRQNSLLPLWLNINRSQSHSFLLTVASFKDHKTSFHSGDRVSIYVDGHLVEKIALKKKMLKTYFTKKGKVTIKIQNGKAWVLESSCFHKICCYSPPASLAGERIICAPNHFLLEIEASPLVDTVIG